MSPAAGRPSGDGDQLLLELPGEEPAPAAPSLDALAVARLLRRHPPTPEQRAVVEAGLEPLLVVAGAGSGKTETMAARVVQLVVSGQVAPDRVLGLTFTRKAAGELAERVRVRLRGLRAALAARGDGALVVPEGEPVVATYHSYAAGVLAEHGLRVGVEPGARVLGEAAAWQLASEVVERWTGDLPGVDSAVSTVVQGVLALAAEGAEHLVEPEALDAALGEVLERVGYLPKDDAGGAPARPTPSSPVGRAVSALRARRALVPLLHAYAERKAAAEALDFGDQVRLAARAAARAPAVGAVERGRYDVVLLDEYQDTSHAQLELLRHLFGGGHPVTAVGDPHQSIYGFRGASAGTLERFPAQFPRADGAPAPVLHLSTSWRNDEEVLVAANAVSAPLRGPVPDPVGTDPVDADPVDAAPVGTDPVGTDPVDAAPVVPAPAGADPATGSGPAVPGPGRSRGTGAPLVPPLAARPEAGRGEVRASWSATSVAEADALAEGVERAWRAPGGQPTAAVLCRRRAQIPAVEQALRARGLPVEVVGMGGLLERPEVLDVLAVLRVLHDPGRGDALARLLTGPRWHLGPRDLRALGRWARRLADDPVGAVEPAPEADPAGEVGPEGVPSAEDAGAPGTRRDRPEPSEAAGLVEALAALAGDRPGSGPQRGLSPEGHRRLVRLARELAGLRARSGQPLPDLVADVVRTTHLDVELAAAPGASPSSARAQLDALTEVAASFTESARGASLGGFLAWVDAAAARERGLEQAEEDDPVGEPDEVEPSRTAVQVLTVHAAKGLEWDVVAVPGLAEGTFPSRVGGGRAGAPDTGSGWLVGLDALPYDLRGDAASLPRWQWGTARSLEELTARTTAFQQDCGAHAVDEERRLAYVALTRARHLLLLSGASWTPGRKTPVRPSRFLLEVAAALGPDVLADLERSAAETGEGAPPPDAVTAPWPDPSGPPEALRGAAEAVRAVLAGASSGTAPLGEQPATEWTREVDLLLAERAAARRPVRDVELPAHLSASRVVAMARDPQALALAVRRPMPAPPARAARRGTAFHAWLEQRWGAAALVDLDDLPGAQDEGAADDAALPALQAAFEASEWASRVPVAVEVAVETPVDGTVLRGRVDAVFRTPSGGYEVVDWKTGRPPGAGDERAAAVQLAVYRLAWSRVVGVPLEDVSAAFFYAATGSTVRPVEGLDEQALLAVLRSAPLEG
ncbi:UvrD-helicase domain-containing protein [uncultured Pseudokineococcus sp.]|uniref:UvrD-helicase domain-containing protein n=1 Tax=uncultured Pseudokineococcus sp. TaxID=1642928 RepID=UPI00260EE257|nr:UvrD-helicase domain-containing protein [uncultured Pseudokineococcus sp.]